MISAARVSRHITLATDLHNRLQQSPLMLTTGCLSRTMEALVRRYLEKPDEFLVKAAEPARPIVWVQDSGALPENLQWRGEGPPPASWWVGGVKVYRSYADYCDD